MTERDYINGLVKQRIAEQSVANFEKQDLPLKENSHVLLGLGSLLSMQKKPIFDVSKEIVKNNMMKGLAGGIIQDSAIDYASDVYYDNITNKQLSKI